MKRLSSHGKSGLDGTQISPGVESSAASGEAYASKRKQDWGSKMKRIRPLLAMAFALALICLGGSFAFADDEGGSRSMRGGAASVADPSSMDDWAVILGGETPNTANIGRIWTDKTVSTDTITTSSGSVINRGDSAFITALSALSSTSNVKSSSTTPLDIVLVLDASGSMDDSMDDGTKRIDALKSAANNFVNHIAEQNQGISDSSKQHQVSIVKFSGDKSAAVGNDTYYRGGYKYNYSQVMKAMSPCTDAAAFRDTINSINPAGSTRADYGLQLADSQTSNREDAKKIVIFFTDGSPTSSSGFESEVASSAVSAAKAMKDKGTTVYTVGIFSGADPSADPSGASNENKFMHAVSSNYPEASYTQNSGFWGGWNWNLGTRPDGSDFYKSATNADELKKVFDDISSEIVKGSGYPTNATEGAEHTSGYIIFDDALGAYMQVDSFKAIALNGQTFENPTKTTAGNVDTYTFDGTVAMGDKSVSLGNVVITVTKSTDLAVGDKVRVKVPAALIPLRSYNVDQKSMTMTVSDAKPINVVYTSSLKPGVESLLANPDDAMSEYLQANSQEGKASFYSNDWKQGYLGNTIANFEPSSDNIYYYFTSDTPIYTDEACTQRAHQVVKGNKYWYKYSYYEMTNAGSGAVEEKEKVVSFSGADAEAIEGSIGVDSQGAYFKAGTARLTYLNELYKAKTSNETGTAIDVLNPKWVGAGQVGAYLGNNGKLTVDLPGALTVTKELKVPDGYSANDFANDSFEFTVAVPEAATKSFSAVVKNASGEQQGDAFTLTFDGEGKASHNLKAGETLYVYGLAGGWSYTVTESDRAGFTQAGTDLTGAIAAGETVNAKVVNTYSASGTLEGQQGLTGKKIFTGRDMADGETFGFELSAADETTQNAVTAGTVTLPGAATVSGAKADEVKGFQFGEITFKKPGEYTFNVNETKWNGEAVPAADGNGMQFDRSTKTVKVTVTDDHTGSLKAEVTYPNGAAAAAFANKYATSSTYNGIQVEKTLTGRDMKAGEFNFVIEGKDPASAALLADSDKQFTNPNNRAEGIADVMTKIAGHTFTQADSGKHFEFTVKEVIPNGAVQDQTTGLWYVEESGLYYDGANHVVTIDVADDGNGQLKVATEVDGKPGNVVSFANKYRAQDVSFDTANAELNKILQGRDWIENDSFDFTISALDGAPMPMRDGNAVSSVTLKSPNSKDGDAVLFDFGQITFTSDMVKDAPGHTRTFTYEVTETAGNLPGIQYSTNKATIQITVSDNGKGQLVASATTQNGYFENRYSAELNYTAAGGLNLAKTLTGRDMTDGQFSIKIKPADQAAANVLGLPNDGKVVSMPAAQDGTQVVKSALDSQVVFDQGNAGKTYTYKVAEQGTAPDGYTYDTAERTVTITVEGDAERGTLKATTVVSGGSEDSKTYECSSDPAGPQETAVVPFKNSYAAASGEVGITATKSLTGRDLTEGEFSFAVKYAKGSDDLLTASNEADGFIDFGTLSYNTESLAQLVNDGYAVKKTTDNVSVWTISYVAYEKIDSLHKLPGGVSAQTQYIPFKVTVADNGDGKLTATANTGDDGLVFKNVYSTGGPVSVGLSGMKVLKSDAGLTPASIEGKFTFTVTSDDAAAPMPQKATATNDANGNVDFGDIKFTLDDLNKALGTNGTRVADADDETKGASSEEAATDAAGQSASDQGSAAGADSEEQGNAAASDGTEQGQGAAVVTGEGTGAASVSTAANKVAGAEDADQASAQSDEPATRAGVARSHTFTYKVTESGSADGVTNDTETKTVKFEVTDHGDGKLTVQRVGGDPAAAFTFTNTYSVQPVDSSVTDQVTITKNLTGRDMKAGEFEFQLLEGTNVVATGTNDASGKVALSPITYTKPGTYNYTLCEVGGGSQKAGVQYDGSTFAVTTTVTDNGKGTLSVAHKVDNDANTVGFTNSYAPAATSVTLGASKVLNGKSLDAEEFTFVLTDEGGEQVTATNDANGMVVFPAIQYGEAGKYQYTIAEVEGDESDVTYDESKYAVAVTVEDNGEGSLVATVAYEGGNAPVFTNTYNAPEAPASPGDGPASVVEALVSGSAKTGDYLLVIAGVAAAVAAAAAAVAVVSRRKKGKHAKR